MLKLCLIEIFSNDFCALKFPNPKNKKQSRSDFKNFIEFSLSKNKKDFGNKKTLTEFTEFTEKY